MTRRTYPELGKSNLVRCLEANALPPDRVDLEALYDDTLTPGENIENVTNILGVKTTRMQAAELAYYKAVARGM